MSSRLPITVIGAYAHDYATSKEVMLAWMVGKDFYITTPGHPSYINREDAERYGVPENIIRFRFKGRQELLILKLVDGKWEKDLDTTKEQKEVVDG